MTLSPFSRCQEPYSPLWQEGVLPAFDLFAGCGGTSLGLQQAKLDVCGAVEINKTSADSYRSIVGVAPIVNDIRKVSGQDLLRQAGLTRGECFLLTACPPCQGFSSQRKASEGIRDPRNPLIHEVVRMTDELLPAYLLLENVPGLYNGLGQTLFLKARQNLEELGYIVSPGVLDAADYGVPQRRRRLIVLARHNSMPVLALGRPTHQNPATTPRLHTYPPLASWRTVAWAIQDLPPLTSGQVHQKDPLHAAPVHSVTVMQRIQAIPINGGSRVDLPRNLVLECHRDDKHTGHKDVYGRMHWDRPAPTLTGGCNKPSKGRFLHPDQHRAISLREAATLQTFPPGAQFVGAREEIAEQIGNAVPPLFVATLVRPLRAAFQEWLRQNSIPNTSNRLRELSVCSHQPLGSPEEGSDAQRR